MGVGDRGVIPKWKTSDGDALPEVLNVKDFAALLRISPAALRRRAARGQVPPPFRSGRALAWRRGSVLSWLWDCGRSVGLADMKITLRPYSNDTNRWHVDIRLMNPCNPEREIRKRKVAPAGLSKAQARTWGEHEVPKILRKVLGADFERDDVSEKAKASKDRTTLSTSNSPATRGEMTLAEFYFTRFEPEHVRMQKPATQVNYDSIWRNHIGPLLGEMPLAAIDEDRLSRFRATLRERVSVTSVNLILGKVAKILRFAQRLRAIRWVPIVDKLPTPRPRPKAVLSAQQIDALLQAARSRGPASEIICLLALDAGLRASEICAVEWGDIDLKEGAITVQHNSFRGESQTPKGNIGKLALTSALWRALADHRKREPIGPLVLYRRSHHTGMDWAPHTPHSIWHALSEANRKAGLPDSGPHLLRHTALTRLANLGASIYVVQAVARHSRLATTAAYLHQQQIGLAHEAADLLNRQHHGKQSHGKTVAKLAKAPK